MHIRKIQTEHLEALSRLYEQFWGDKSSVEAMTRSLNKIKDNPNYIHLNAFIDNNLVGSIAGIICESLYGQCAPYMLIEDFIVDRAFRRKGIGQSLITEIEQLAKKAGCCQIILITENERQDAIGFYTSAGFTPDTHKGFKKTLD